MYVTCLIYAQAMLRLDQWCNVYQSNSKLLSKSFNFPFTISDLLNLRMDSSSFLIVMRLQEGKCKQVTKLQNRGKDSLPFQLQEGKM
jgi:hypothetical protein